MKINKWINCLKFIFYFNKLFKNNNSKFIFNKLFLCIKYRLIFNKMNIVNIFLLKS